MKSSDLPLMLLFLSVALGVICILLSFRIDACAENGNETSISFGSIKFKYYSKISQPLPKIKDGIALDEYVSVPIGNFYLTETQVRASDFPDFFDMLEFPVRNVPYHTFDSLNDGFVNVRSSGTFTYTSTAWCTPSIFHQFGTASGSDATYSSLLACNVWGVIGFGNVSNQGL